MPDIELAATPEMDGEIPTQDPGPAPDEGAEPSPDASAGPPEEVDWKERYNEARRGGEEAGRRVRELEQRLQQAQYQPQPWQMPQPQYQPQPQQPQFDNEGYTPEMRAELQEAEDKLDLTKQRRIVEKAASNREQRNLLSGLLLNTQLQGIQQQNAQVESALSAKIQKLGQDAWPAVIQEALRIQNDPAESIFLKDNSQQSYRTVEGGHNVNLYALEKAASRLGTRSKGKASAQDLEAPQAPRGAPGTPSGGGGFDSKRHLTQVERQQNEMIRSKDPTWTDERYFKGFPEGMQKLRKKGEMITRKEYKQRYGE